MTQNKLVVSVIGSSGQWKQECSTKQSKPEEREPTNVFSLIVRNPDSSNSALSGSSGCLLSSNDKPSAYGTVRLPSGSCSTPAPTTGLKRACRLGVAGKGEGSSTGLGNVRELIAALVAEFLGTGLLVGVGCTAAIVRLPGPLTPTILAADLNETTYCAMPETMHHNSSMQPAFIFGLMVAAIIQMFGHISQAHLNPAVTLTAVVLGMLTWPKAILYVITQCLGAVFGFGVLKLITPCGIMSPPMTNPEVGFCTTVPSMALTSFQAILAEGIATAVLIFVVCSVWDKRNAHNTDSAPIKFGLTIAALAMGLGPYTGASMNPARSLGPAMWNHVWTRHWIYWLAPMGSALLTSAFYRIVLWPAEPNDDDKINSLEEDGDPLTRSKADAATTRL